MRPMVLKYFHDSFGSGHLGARKSFQKVTAHFGGQKCRLKFWDTLTSVSSVRTIGRDHLGGVKFG